MQSLSLSIFQKFQAVVAREALKERHHILAGMDLVKTRFKFITHRCPAKICAPVTGMCACVRVCVNERARVCTHKHTTDLRDDSIFLVGL